MDAHWCYNISKELNYKVVYYMCVCTKHAIESGLQ